MKNFFILLFFTLFALDVSAQFRPSQSQYFDIDNTFKNMGFEQGYDGWDITTTCTKSVEVEVPYLNRSLKLVCVAQDFEVSQSTSKLSGLDIMGLSSVKMSTTALGVEYKIFNDLTETINREIPINTKLARYEIPYVIDELDNTAKLTATSYTGTVIIDDFKLGIAPEGYTQGVQVVSDWEPYTPTDTTYSWGSVSASTFKSMYFGENFISTIDLTLSSTLTGSFILSDSEFLKSGLSVSDKRGENFTVGTWVAIDDSASSGNNEFSGVVYYRSGAGLFLITSDNDVVDSTSPFTFASGDILRITLDKIPVNELSATPQSFISQKRELTAKTANVFGAEISSSGVATGDSYNFINGDCTFTGGNTYTCPLSDMNITKRLICSDAQNATSNEVTYSLSSSTSELVFFVPSAVSFNITCVKHDDDLNKSIEGIMTLTETSIVQNRDQYSETEIKWGLWNGEQLYRRCFTVGSNITTDDETIDTWVASLKPIGIPKEDNYFTILNNSTNVKNTRILYNSANGLVVSNMVGGGTIQLGTSACMEYTK